jgi:hypothetical protein
MVISFLVAAMVDLASQWSTDLGPAGEASECW